MKNFKWTVNIKHTILDRFKEYIHEVYKTLALENDGAELSMLNDSRKFSSQNDQGLCEMLHIFVSKNNLKFTMFIKTPSKLFSDWSFPKIWQLYDLGESDDPSSSVVLSFTCEYKELKENSSKVILNNLVTKLKARLKSIPKHQNHNMSPPILSSG